jgi:hypothetical protein
LWSIKLGIQAQTQVALDDRSDLRWAWFRQQAIGPVRNLRDSAPRWWFGDLADIEQQHVGGVDFVEVVLDIALGGAAVNSNAGMRRRA